MGLMRSILLAGSQSAWLRQRAPRFAFVRRTVSRFMPGEAIDDAMGAARKLQENGIASVFTLLGENVTAHAEAEKVRGHYVEVLGRIGQSGLPASVSVKLTQLGLDLGADVCHANLECIIQAAARETANRAPGTLCSPADSMVWIDIESSAYTDATLDIYRRARAAYPNVGVCLQAYLYRTANDLASLIPLGSAIRLVKGAYKEPPEVAFPRKKDVDENFFKLAQVMLSEEARRAGLQPAIATHDCALIRRIEQYAQPAGVGKGDVEFQMLYGIQRPEQLRLAREGWKARVLVSYGSYWFPWFMRRLAERPANMWFMMRHMLGG